MKGHGDAETASLGLWMGSLLGLLGFAHVVTYVLLPGHPTSMLGVGSSMLGLATWMFLKAWDVIGGMEGLDAWGWSRYLDKLTRKALRSAPGPCTCLLIEQEATEWICIHHGRVCRALSGYNRIQCHATVPPPVPAPIALMCELLAPRSGSLTGSPLSSSFPTWGPRSAPPWWRR